MAQAAAMGPPLSPRETRRSGRRSAPSASTSTSKSPQPESAPQPKEKTSRSSGSASTTNSRNRRPKQEDVDDSVDDPKTTSHGPAGRQPNANGRSKRKSKDKEKSSISIDTTSQSTASKAKSVVSNEEAVAESPEDEEQGVTRCVCGSSEDDPDAGEFMVQCETCKVWQHGLCMGFESEQQLHDDDYYCEQCRPELHQELFKKLSRKARHPSTSSHHNPISATSRVSRSHSPMHLSKPAKRRNTMNSRDAAFDESLKELIEATAAEAAAAQDTRSVASNGNTNRMSEPRDEPPPGNRKKRKRPDEDVGSRKRNRSASTASERLVGPAVPPAETPVVASSSKTTQVANSKSGTTRNRRGGARKQAIHEAPATAEGGEAPHPPRRQGQGGRSRGTASTKRAPPSTVANAPGNAAHDHGTRRNNTSGANGSAGMHIPSSAEASRAYRNSHAYAVSQQPLFTSWNLPDYLAHLEPMLPTEIPQPLEVRGFGTGANGKDAVEGTVERGVKVKWPSKRMSVGDMNKRVRALVEWVGREQAGALDRGRRREALEKALKAVVKEFEGDPLQVSEATNSKGGPAEASVAHANILTGEGSAEPSGQDNKPLRSMTTNIENGESIARPSTMKIMEELMEELISFQERFGPGAKVRERERRLAAT